MKLLWMFLLACGAACAQSPLTPLVCSGGCSTAAPFTAPYHLPDTAQWAKTSTEFEFQNSSSSAIELVGVITSNTQDFSATFPSPDELIAAGGTGAPFSVYFTPQSIGPFTTTLTISYCTLDVSGNCATGAPIQTETIALQGNGIAPPVTLSCSGSPTQCDGSPIKPGSTLDFGYVSNDTTSAVTFTVLNSAPSAITVSLPAGGPFSSDPAAPFSATVAAGASATFAVDFSPTQVLLSETTLTVGAASYTLRGAGVDNTPGGSAPLKFMACSANCSTSQPLYTPWDFPKTPEGEENSLLLRAVNPTGSPIKVIYASLTDTKNFSVTNFYVDDVIAPGKIGTPFLLHFTPQQTGSLSTTLSIKYCLPDSSGNCGTTSGTEIVAKFDSTGTAPEVVLSCSGAPSQCDGSALRPAALLDFGNVLVGTTSAIQFTVKNGSHSLVSIALQTPVNLSSPFSSDSAAPIPAPLAAGDSATFTINFSPGQAVLSQVTLLVGNSSFPLQGNGVTSAAPTLSSLVVSYTDAAGVREVAQGGAIDFGQVVTGTSATLNVSVCNPQITLGSVTIPVPAVSGSGFTVSGLPSAPVSIPNNAMPPYCEPGDGTVTFPIVFTASAAGTYSGTLSIGTLQFALAVQSVTPPLPPVSIQVSEQPLTSGWQPNLTLQLASPSQGTHKATLAMTFQPSVQSVGGDPAIKFLATNGRQLDVAFAESAQTGTYNGQSAIGFQTGTTAGSITFTLRDAGVTIGSQKFDIAPEIVHIASATAQLSSPNIVVTINGYDNTYTVGQLSFTFYDTKGNMIAPGAIAVDASSEFHQYFFTNNKAGGAFALQASFPVRNGDAGEVGSVSVTLNNSAGPATTKLTVQ